MNDEFPETVKLLLHRMAWKMARQNQFSLGDFRVAQQDLYQAGCEGYLVYRNARYFPIKSIRYYMLNELARICWESSWQGQKTPKRLPDIPLEHVNESELPQADGQLDQALNYAKVYEAAVESDKGRGKAGQHTKHVRTLRMFARYGMGGRLPAGVKPDTYWYACKSLERFANTVTG